MIKLKFIEIHSGNLKTISWIVLMGFMWSNIVTYYPQIEEILPSINKLHHVMDFESAFEEEEIEETCYNNKHEEVLLLGPLAFNSVSKRLQDCHFAAFHHPEIVTPPPELDGI